MYNVREFSSYVPSRTNASGPRHIVSGLLPRDLNVLTLTKNQKSLFNLVNLLLHAEISQSLFHYLLKKMYFISP